MERIKQEAQGVEYFLKTVKETPLRKPSPTGQQGRLIFAMDATASREPTWDMACQIQSDMFMQPDCIDNLSVQLVYYRGYHECKASRWVNSARDLLKLMSAIRCRAGGTQISRVIKHAISENKERSVQAVVFVGDCLEEPLPALLELAGQLRLFNSPLFIFQEGYDQHAGQGFQKLAKVSGGVYCQFDQYSASQLSALLNAVSAYTVGGKDALKKQLKDGRMQAAQQLLEQLNSP